MSSEVTTVVDQVRFPPPPVFDRVRLWTRPANVCFAARGQFRFTTHVGHWARPLAARIGLAQGSQMRIGNVITAVSTALWAALLMNGRELVRGVAQRAPWPGIADQFDYYVLIPTAVLLVLLTLAWILNSSRRWPRILSTASAVSLLALFPYMFFYFGGV